MSSEKNNSKTKKGRKQILSKEDINDIVEALKIDPSLTRRDIAMKYRISLSTLYNHLPPEVKDQKYTPKSKRS